MMKSSVLAVGLFFFFNDTATTEIYTLSLHDALPISPDDLNRQRRAVRANAGWNRERDRKSTRLNSSHPSISYGVFCLNKKNIHNPSTTARTKKNKKNYIFIESTHK